MSVPEYIPRPEDAKFRTLIVLLDGTGDSGDEDFTNVFHLWKMLYDKDDNKQKLLYAQGLGTSKAGSFKPWLQKKREQVFGANFGVYVTEPYLWLAKNYMKGDKICIFGFSRGAYTARALAGMINALGLLPEKRANEVEVKDAYDLYDDYTGLSEDQAVRDDQWNDLERRFQDFIEVNQSQEVFVEFLGCWDTVNSIGCFSPIKLGFTRTNDIVLNFRHAIALDEHRVKFKQNNWSGPTKPKETSNLLDRRSNKEPRCITNAEEVWFAGCHCDVGGGSVLNGTRPNLAHISLRWMIRECFKRNTGIIFKSAEIKFIGVEPSSVYPKVLGGPGISSPSGSVKIPVAKPQDWLPYFKSFNPFTEKQKGTPLQPPNKPEEDLDMLDALAPAYDQLLLKNYMWPILDGLAVVSEWWNEAGKWEGGNENHDHHVRTIPPLETQHGGKIMVHRTVRVRMEGGFESGENQGQKYVPLARVWCDGYKAKITFTDAIKQDMIKWVA